MARDLPEKFSKPIRIDIRGRKFKLNPEQFNIDVEAEVPEGRVIEVQGSKGDVYRVTELRGEWSCTCSGFKFRRRLSAYQRCAMIDWRTKDCET
jgi:hypothetical protein